MHLSDRALFISDLHLDESRPAMAALFERFLATEAARASRLFILGDLFESWVGDDGLALAFPRRIAEALARASAATPTYFLHGNRDFLVGEGFARASGVTLLADPTQIDLANARALLLHGDTLCTDDHDYQAFRAKVRDPAWQAATLARPLAERLALARELREGSESAKQGKAMAIMDVTPAAVENAFRVSGRSLMIHGHTHRPARHEHRVDGRVCVRWVLTDWYERGGYLEATAAGLRAAEFA